MPSTAMWVALVWAWSQVSPEQGAKKIWKRIAYATRYGKGCSLHEALTLDQLDLNSYLDALSEIVTEENRANKPGR